MQETQWFVAILDANTNEWLAKYLAENAKEVFTENLIDKEGVPRQCYRVDYNTIDLLNKSKAKFGFKFIPYSRYGKNGELKEWKFANKAKKIVTRVRPKA